jgi:hypothetical protein
MAATKYQDLAAGFASVVHVSANACVLPMAPDEAALSPLVQVIIPPDSKIAMLGAHRKVCVEGEYCTRGADGGKDDGRPWWVVLSRLSRAWLCGALGVEWVAVGRKWGAVAGHGRKQQGMPTLLSGAGEHWVPLWVTGGLPWIHPRWLLRGDMVELRPTGVLLQGALVCAWWVGFLLAVEAGSTTG